MLYLHLNMTTDIQPHVMYLKAGSEYAVVEDGSHNDLFRFLEYTSKLDSILQLR